jgi:hypothetical protein
MGAKLVGQAFAFAARHSLTHSETLLLVWMAHTALDADVPPRYFAAREHSAVALGRLVPDAPDPSSPDAAVVIRERAAAFQRVKLATQGLVRARAIVSSRRGREGQRAEYKLTFGAVGTGDSEGTESVPLTGTESVPLSESKTVLHPVRNAYPQGITQEQPRDTRRETPVPAATYVRPVERSEAA